MLRAFSLFNKRNAKSCLCVGVNSQGFHVCDVGYLQNSAYTGRSLFSSDICSACSHFKVFGHILYILMCWKFNMFGAFLLNIGYKYIPLNKCCDV